MSITILSDVILPERVITAGIRGKQIRRNSRVTTDSGAEAINIVWTQTLREYELGFIPMQRQAWQDIETIHEITEGGAYGFLLSDPKDGYVDNGRFASLTSTTFQLYKRYIHADSMRTKDRKITRPRSTTGTLLISGVPKTLGVDYTVDDATGIFTIPSGPSAANLTWTGYFYVPVHFMDDTIDWELVAGGAAEARFLAGPSVMLQEVRE
jgi:uncharacterized protein (TIGR02217 family)